MHNLNCCAYKLWHFLNMQITKIFVKDLGSHCTDFSVMDVCVYTLYSCISQFHR